MTSYCGRASVIGIVARCMAGLALLALWSCNGGRLRGEARPETSVEALTVEAARAALVSLIEASPADGPVRQTAASVRSEPARTLPDGRIAIGPWECDLVKRTFTFAIVSPPLFFSQQGVFKKTSAGWEAVVTETTQT